MTFLRYTETDGTEREIGYTEAELEKEFDRQWAARVFINRDKFDEDGVERGETKMYVVESQSQTNENAAFGGRFRDVSRQGSVTEIIIDSFERDARDALPTDGGERWQNADDTQIVQDAIDNVPTLTAGTVEAVASTPVSTLFSHSTQAKKIRTTADIADADVRYNADQSVDYLTRLGADKTDTTLSPSNQNITGDFKAEKKGGEEDVTHLRVLGAGEGNHQKVVNFVPNDDSGSYDEKRTYQNAEWTSGDRKKWKVISNKDLTDLTALEEWGRNKITDINSDPYIDVETAVRGVDVTLGDTFHVLYPEEEVDHEMRVVQMTEVISPSGTEFEVKMSTRKASRVNDSSKDRQDIQRYNKALEGNAVPINASGGRQPVNSDNRYQFQFYYPGEVEYEHRLNVRVMGLPYRAYSQGSAAGGDHTHAVEVTHPSHAHTITSQEFSHTHTLSSNLVSANQHGHGDGTYGANSHPHGDGSYGANSHPHGDGSYGANSHGHFSGTYGADSHGHDSGTYDADNHQHDANTYGADPHPHDHNLGDTTDPFPGRDAVAVVDSGLTTLNSTGGSWDTVDTFYPADDYEMAVVHVHATRPDATVTVRVEDNVGSTGQGFWPRENGIPLWGTGSAQGSGSVTIIVPQDVASIEVQYNSGSGTGNITATAMFIEPHTHDVLITGDSQDASPSVQGWSGSTGPAVLGNSGDESPDVSGQSSDDAPGVSGQSSESSPGVSGSSSESAPGVNGTSGDTGPGVAGESDSQGGVRTSETELGTTVSETTGASGPHQHPPDPGLIESFGGSINFPENCDVYINGTQIDTNFGDGSGQFQEKVDIRGELIEGAVNTIEISSESLGHIQAFVEGDVYRQILGGG